MESSTDTAPSIAVVKQIAAVEGVRPIDLQPPLRHVLDPDALDRLVDGGDASTSVAFEYLGHSVRMDGSGEVIVDGSETTAGPVGIDGSTVDDRGEPEDVTRGASDRSPGHGRNERSTAERPDSVGDGREPTADDRSDAPTDD
ncbi:HalOD1 output domain-containing protein [Halovivax limisalsi]|uniref:HalOD1 output domain-containing protein n=1 Tax=Halovivax limisalsi TaxID=1453760 RepID=UPI001FFC5318|nr:HalOD1 output domain-containing protein [Halovivax limisalsi]